MAIYIELYRGIRSEKRSGLKTRDHSTDRTGKLEHEIEAIAAIATFEKLFSQALFPLPKEQGK